MDKDTEEYEQEETLTESRYAMQRLEVEPEHCRRGWTMENKIEL